MYYLTVKILFFSNGYHGAFAHFGAGAGDIPLNIPHDFVIGRYNETAYNNQFLAEDLAATLVEPLQGAGGMIPATPEFLTFLRRTATRTSANLIFDEIITS
ncbi:pyridoxal phosphate-dependent transferase [Aspergillus granulosus]|uniref:Pyridoxal phosphate-dependent transferase n=1 Tax=Aspergillus granulosus TaxID=176169 RepID=A0ABR4GT22_9EURO